MFRVFEQLLWWLEELSTGNESSEDARKDCNTNSNTKTSQLETSLLSGSSAWF
jgi:hypothetical protein